MQYLKHIVIFVALLSLKSVVSQTLWNNDKHQLQLRGKYLNTFDEVSTFDSGSKRSGSIDFSYKLNLSENHYIGASLYNYVYSNRLPLVESAQGVITRREFKGGDISYYRNFHTSNRLKFATSVGLAYRSGFQNTYNEQDSVLNDDGTFSPFPVYVRKPINDFGLSIGLDNTYNINKWLHFNVKLDYSYFLIRASELDPTIPWDKNVPRSLFATSFGLGVNFGNQTIKSGGSNTKAVFDRDKNSLRILYSMVSFFDGAGFLPKQDVFSTFFYPFGIGLEYKRNYKKDKEWFVSVIGVNNIVNKVEGYTPGDVALKQFALLNYGVSNFIFKSSRQNLQYSFGLTNRIGYEEIFIGTGVFGIDENGVPLTEGVFIENSYLDFGSTGGLNYKFNLTPNFHVMSNLAYTFYAFTFDQKSTFSVFDEGTPRHQVMLNLGLGLNFGRTQNEVKKFGFEGVFEENEHQMQVNLISSLYSFFDQTPIFERTNYFDQTFTSLGISYGLEFIKNLNDTWGWQIGIEDFEFSVPRQLASGIENGTVLDKSFWLFRGSALQNILSKENYALKIQYGVSYRRGGEIIIGKDENPDPLSYDIIEKKYSDIGVHTGMQFDFLLYNRISIGTHLNYTFFPVIDYISDGVFEWDKNTSRNMISFGIHCGFNF